MLIFQINEGSQTCSSCGARLSEYFCFKCKHFTGVEKNPFHCEKCGICRYVLSVLHFCYFNVLCVCQCFCCLHACLSVCLFHRRIFMSFSSSQRVTNRLNKPAKNRPDLVGGYRSLERLIENNINTIFNSRLVPGRPWPLIGSTSFGAGQVCKFKKKKASFCQLYQAFPISVGTD